MGRINQLAEKTTLNSTDVIAVDAGAGGNTNKMTGANLAGQLKALGDYQDKLTFDTTPTAGSTNPVTSGGVKTALDGKQNTLTFDTTPTAGSTNPVTSGGIATAIQQSTASGEIYVVYGTYCTVQKKAGVVYVYGNSSGGLSLTGDADWHSLTTIPSGYRPANTVYFAGASASGKGISFRINANGILEYVAGTGNTTSYWSYGVSYISE